jgi:hypothetical protein
MPFSGVYVFSENFPLRVGIVEILRLLLLRRIESILFLMCAFRVG